ncbi:MAG: FAD:protein FMN transferase [Candidatus Woesearchaeota archaeon]|jgi:thiamine biosynthesis lipoprotein
MAVLTIPLLGKEITLIAYDVDQDLLDLYKEEIVDEAKRLEKIFNLYDPESELSQLNKQRIKEVSQEFLYVLTSAMHFCKETNGEYDISKGKLFVERKSGKSLSSIACMYHNIIIDGKKVSLKHSDVLIDLGSIAKGYIGDKLVRYLFELGIEKCFVDMRGDLRIVQHEEKVGIQHPRENKIMFHIVLNNAAAATSGDYNQYTNCFEENHIVGSKEIISVTVIAETLMEADVVATCLMVLGIEKAETFLKKFSLKTCMIDKSLKMHFYNNFESIVLN